MPLYNHLWLELILRTLTAASSFCYYNLEFLFQEGISLVRHALKALFLLVTTSSYETASM